MLACLKEYIKKLQHKANHNKKYTYQIQKHQINDFRDVCQQLAFQFTSSPKLFAKCNSQLLNILDSYMQESDPGIVLNIYELIIESLNQQQQYYNYSSLHKNKNNQVIKLFILICKEIEKTIPDHSQKQEQQVPPLRFLKLCQIQQSKLDRLEETDPDSALVIKYTNLLSRTIELANMKDIYKDILISLGELANKTWKSQCAVMITTAQLCQVGQFKDFANYSELVYKNLLNSNQYLRYYAIYSLCKICKTRKQQFQDKYFNQLIALIIQGFDDPIDQIANQWMESFCQICQDVQEKESTKVQPFLQAIITKISLCMQNSKNSYKKQKCLDVIITLSSIPKILDQNILKKLLQLCYCFLYSPQLKLQNQFQSLNNKQENRQQETKIQMIINACQCMTQIINCVDYFYANSYVNSIVGVFCQNIEYFCLQKHRMNLYAAWQNLCGTGVKFNNWKQLFQRVFNVVKTSYLNAYQEQKMQIFRTIKATALCFQQQFCQCSMIVLQMLSAWLRQEIKKKHVQSVQLISQTIDLLLTNSAPLVNKINESTYSTNSIITNQAIRQMLNYYMCTLVQNLGSTNQKQILQSYNDLQAEQLWLQIKSSILFSLKNLVQYYGHILNADQFNNLVCQFWEMVEYFHSKKRYLLLCKKQIKIDADYQEIQVLQVTYDQSEDKEKPRYEVEHIQKCKLCMPGILQKILKYVKDPTSIISKALSICQRQLACQNQVVDIACGSLYISTLVQALPYQSLSMYWQNFLKHYQKYSAVQNVILKQQISFTIGLMSEKTPIELMSKSALDYFIEIINKCYSVSQKSKQTYFYGDCQDNCISSVGKIVMRFGKIYDLRYLYNGWLSKLPLKNDEDENKIQIKILCQIITKQPQILFQSSPKQSQTQITYVVHLLRIFAQLKMHVEKQHFNRERKYRQLLSEVKVAMQVIIQFSVFKQNQIRINGMLPSQYMKELEQLLQRY